MRRTAALALGVALVMISAGCSAMRGASGNCQQRILDKIRADHPQSQRSTIDADSVVRRSQGDNRVGISGRGKVKTAKGDFRNFSFSCTYDEDNDRLTKVRYTIE